MARFAAACLSSFLFCSGRILFVVPGGGSTFSKQGLIMTKLQQSQDQALSTLWSLNLFSETGGGRGCEALFYGCCSQPFILSSLPIMYPRLVSVFIKILKNIPWQKERETVDISANSSLWGCVERSWQGWKEQFPFRRGWEEEFSNQCSAKRGIHLQTCSLRPAVEALRHSSSK